MSDRNELTDSDTGTFKVRTYSGTVHLLDLNPPSRTVIRLPREYMPNADDVEGAWKIADLRRDSETLFLLGILRLRVGERAYLVIDVREDGIETVRETTEVLSITELRDRT